MNAFLRWFAAGLGSLFVLVVGCLAWGNLGHQAVATVAWNELNPKARNAVTAICAGDQSVFNQLTGLEGLKRGATWPDFIRDQYRLDDFTGPNATLHIFGSIGVPRASKADHLHYADRDTAGHLLEPNGQSAIAAINLCRAVLKNSASTPRAKAEALAFVTHCVGDLHQPLHAGYEKDRGGNSIEDLKVVKGADAHGQLQYDSSAPEKLHSIWDSYLFKNRGYTDTQAQKLYDKVLKPKVSKLKATAAADMAPESWAESSFQLAKEKAYVDEHGQTIADSTVLSRAYIERGEKVADQQVVLAGLRLANILNDALGK
ncbi:MAG TPA: S1/P1 nuclease [Candidatus Didemnitutus sp.]|nr:S1/P1 nuclease [Candidatus Didemnitutus sp.]